MARISTFNIGMYSFNAQVVELQSQTSRNRYVQWYLSGSYIGSNTIGTGTTVSPTRTFNNLTAGATYTLTAEIYWSDTSAYITSLSTSVKMNAPADSTAPNITNLYSNIPSHGWVKTSTINLGANITDTGSGVASVNCIFNGQEKSSYSGVSGEYTFSFTTPIVPGSYTVSWSARDNSGNLRSGVSTTYWIGYDNTAPTISSTDISSTGSTIRVGAVGNDTLSGVDSITFKISPQGNNASFGQTATYYASPIGASMSQYHNFTVDGNGNSLSLGKTYYVEITVMDRLGTYVKQVVSVVHSYAKPSAWSWQDYELDAFNNRGKTTVLTYQRWNAFCDHVLAVTSWYYNDATDTYKLAQAKMSDNSRTLTATRFNLVKNAIGSMVSTGITDRKAGDPVLGSYFITLAQKVNSVSK